MGIEENYFTKINRNNILKNNNIKNDLDLIKYIININNKTTIFTNIEKMKETYATKLFAMIAFPKSSITLLNGDYTGYVFNTDDFKECNILYNGKKYTFTFLKLNYFNDEKIYEILNTIKFD